MDWGAQRKFFILTTITIAVFIVGAIFVYIKFFNKAPTCFDGVLNQDEKGVDCGGSCTLLCSDESRPINVVFSRLFSVGYGAYSALAIVENVNQNVFAKAVPYIFKVYDDKNILLTEASGITFAPPGRLFPIFEYSISTGNRLASKVTFQINNNAVLWEKGAFEDPDLKVGNSLHQIVDTRSRVSADVMNNEVYPIKDLQVVAIVYDKDGNARESSSTVIDYISPGDKQHVSFTWNHKFDFEISKIDITPRVMPREWMDSRSR